MKNHLYSAGGVVLDKNGNIALSSSEPGHWSFPKGKIEAGEDTIAAARREIYEEIGVKDLELIKTFEPYDRHPLKEDGTYYTDAVKTLSLFLFRTNEINIHPVDPTMDSAHWFTKKEAAERLSHPRDREFFKSVIDEL